MSSPIRGRSSRPRPISDPTGAATSTLPMSGPSPAKAERRTQFARTLYSTRPRSPAESKEQLMAKSRNEKPSVATYADHEVITPANELRKAASTVAASDPADDPVTRAEQALATLAGEF